MARKEGRTAGAGTLSVWGGEGKQHWQGATQVPEALIRYSVGIEDTSDLIADLEQALAKL